MTGSLLVAVVAGLVTSTATTPGWTKQLSATQECELAVFARTSSGGETSLSLTYNGSNYPLNYVVYELPAGSVWSSGAGNNNGNAPDLTGLPGTPTLAMAALVMISSSQTDSISQTSWGFGWTEDVDMMTLDDGATNGSYLNVGWRQLYTETVVSPDSEGYYGSVYFVNPQITILTSATYSGNAINATNIHSLDNVFQRGTSANDRDTIALTDKRRYTCGGYGVTTGYNSSKAGFQFTGNMWDDGLLFINDTTYPYGGFY